MYEWTCPKCGFIASSPHKRREHICPRYDQPTMGAEYFDQPTDKVSEALERIREGALFHNNFVQPDAVDDLATIEAALAEKDAEIESLLNRKCYSCGETTMTMTMAEAVDDATTTLRKTVGEQAEHLRLLRAVAEAADLRQEVGEGWDDYDRRKMLAIDAALQSAREGGAL